MALDALSGRTNQPVSRRDREMAMDCPVCLSQREDLTPPTYRGQVVVCPRCGGYRITIDALGVLTKLNIDRRLEALHNAKRVTLSRSWPTIDKAILVAATGPRGRR